MDELQPDSNDARDEIDLMRYVGFLGRWWRLIVLCTVLGGLVAWGLSSLSPRTYQTESNLVIVRSGVLFNLDDNKVQAISDVGPGATTSLTDRRVSLLALANSPEVAARVLNKVGNELTANLRDPNVLRQQVRITGSGDLIQVQATGADPNQATLIANSWADSVREMANDVYGDYSLNVEALQPQLDSTRAQYDAAQTALVTYIAQDSAATLTRQIQEKQQILTALQQGRQIAAQTIISKHQEADTRLLVNYLDAVVDTRSAVINQQVSERIQRFDDFYALRRKIQQLLTNANALRQRLDAAGNNNLGGDQLAALLLEASAFSTGADLPVTLQLPLTLTTPVSTEEQRRSLDSLIQTLETTDRDLAAQISVLAQELIENNDYQYLLANAPEDSSELKRAVAAQVTLLLRLEGLEAVVGADTVNPALTSEMDRLQTEISALQAQLEGVNAKKLELESERNLARNTHDTLKNTLAEARVAEQSRGGVLRLATLAIAPRDPVSRNSMVNAAVGAIVGFLVGLFLALANEFYMKSAKISPAQRPGLYHRIIGWVGPRVE